MALDSATGSLIPFVATPGVEATASPGEVADLATGSMTGAEPEGATDSPVTRELQQTAEHRATLSLPVSPPLPTALFQAPTWREGVLGLLVLALLVILGASRARSAARAEARPAAPRPSVTSPLLEPGSLLARMSTGILPVREHVASAIRAADRLRLSLGQTSRKLTDCSRLTQDLAEQASGLHAHLLRASLPVTGSDVAPGLHRLATDLAFAAGQPDVASHVSRLAGDLRRMAQELEHRDGTVTVAYLVELAASWSSRCEHLARQISELELGSTHGGALDTLRDDLMGALGQTHALTDRIRDLESRLAGPEKET